MAPIKFGTDGWRAIIAKDYTVDNVARVAEATARWLLGKKIKPTVVVGYDTRFGGEMFENTVCKVLTGFGIRVYKSREFTTTPMVSLGVVKKKADLGIVITASHNPPAYNGFKLKGPYGGPLIQEDIMEIESMLPDECSIDFASQRLDDMQKKGLIEYTDLANIYYEHVRGAFDLQAIRNSGLRIAYDAMYGSGQNLVKLLLPSATLLHCDYNPSFMHRAPEPTLKNLRKLAVMMRNSSDYDIGFATDGDADRIGIFDSEGNFIDSHHVILLLVKYLNEIKGHCGKVVTAVSVSQKVVKLCEHLGLEHAFTRIGFKYITEKMLTDDVLLGGEESGGIAIKGHIPEKDGIWAALTVLEYMTRTGKSLRDLISDIHEIVGPFAFERSDMHIMEEQKDRIIRSCEGNLYRNFGQYTIQKTETTDGYKYYFSEDEWFLLRFSGTEPVLRNYVQAGNRKNAISILKAAERTLLDFRINQELRNV